MLKLTFENVYNCNLHFMCLPPKLFCMSIFKKKICEFIYKWRLLIGWFTSRVNIIIMFIIVCMKTGTKSLYTVWKIFTLTWIDPMMIYLYFGSLIYVIWYCCLSLFETNIVAENRKYIKRLTIRHTTAS